MLDKLCVSLAFLFRSKVIASLARKGLKRVPQSWSGRAVRSSDQRAASRRGWSPPGPCPCVSGAQGSPEPSEGYM